MHILTTDSRCFNQKVVGSIHLKYFTQNHSNLNQMFCVCGINFVCIGIFRNPYIRKGISNKFIFYVQQLKLKVLSSISEENYLTGIPIRKFICLYFFFLYLLIMVGTDIYIYIYIYIIVLRSRIIIANVRIYPTIDFFTLA